MSDGINVVAAVEIPKAKKDAKYPFAAMKVGESFFLPAKSSQQASSIASAGAKACAGTKYSVRGGIDGAPWGQTGVKGSAVWRVA